MCSLRYPSRFSGSSFQELEEDTVIGQFLPQAEVAFIFGITIARCDSARDWAPEAVEGSRRRQEHA